MWGEAGCSRTQVQVVVDRLVVGRTREGLGGVAERRVAGHRCKVRGRERGQVAEERRAQWRVGARRLARLVSGQRLSWLGRPWLGKRTGPAPRCSSRRAKVRVPRGKGRPGPRLAVPLVVRQRPEVVRSLHRPREVQLVADRKDRALAPMDQGRARARSQRRKLAEQVVDSCTCC